MELSRALSRQISKETNAVTQGEKDPIDLEALKRLDAHAVERFVRESTDKVYSLLFRMLGHPEEVEDLTQDVFVKALRALPRYRGDSAPSTWVYRIAINTGRDAIAKRQRDRKRQGGEMEPERFSSKDDPVEKIEEKEDFTVLRKALDRLPADRKELIMLVDIEGVSIEEAGQIFDLPDGTVKSRLHRARAALREEVREIMGDKQ